MTPDPVRLLSRDDDAFTASLLRSARDGDAAAARTHKAAVLGAAGGAAVGGAALAVAKLSSRGAWSAFGGKWFAAGALVVTGTVGVGAALFWSGASSAPPPVAASAAPLPAPPPSGSGARPRVASPSPVAAIADPAAAASPVLDPAAPDPTVAEHASVEPAPADPPAAPSSGQVSARVVPAPSPGPAAVPAVVPSSAPVSGGAGLSDEVAALRGAHEALGRGQAQRCLEAVDAYFARFPQGRLSAEARFLRVQALVGAGRRAEASALARAMLASNPRSPYAARLRSIAGEDAAPRNP